MLFKNNYKSIMGSGTIQRSM